MLKSRLSRPAIKASGKWLVQGTAWCGSHFLGANRIVFLLSNYSRCVTRLLTELGEIMTKLCFRLFSADLLAVTYHNGLSDWKINTSFHGGKSIITSIVYLLCVLFPTTTQLRSPPDFMHIPSASWNCVDKMTSIPHLISLSLHSNWEVSLPCTLLFLPLKSTLLSFQEPCSTGVLYIFM